MRSAVAGDTAAGKLGELAPAQVPGRWIVTGDLNVPHGGQTATLLQNGKVLVAGGDATGVGAEFGTIRDWNVDNDRQHGHCTGPLENGNVAAKWESAGGWRPERPPPVGKRGTIRSSDWHVDDDRENERGTQHTHGDVAAERAGAGGRWRRHQWHKHRTIQSGHREVDDNRQHLRLHAPLRQRPCW